MRNSANEWEQRGRFYVWRYPEHRKKYGRWHFAGDPVGCRSLRHLLERMMGGPPLFRTWKLAPLSENAWRVPGYGLPRADDDFERLRVEYDPEANDLKLKADADTLRLILGPSRAEIFMDALSKVEAGEGDFAISPTGQKRDEAWMFWWMIDPKLGKEQK